MTVEDNINEFLEKLDKQLKEHDAFLGKWNDIDWHERCVLLDKLLHGMWSTYEDAEDIADSLKNVFPPYPFDEIKEIKKWLKSSMHRIRDFIEDEYTSGDDDQERYLESYHKFLDNICGNKKLVKKWHSRESVIVKDEQELIGMLDKSYSVMLELLLTCYQSLQRDKKAIILAYENSKARYEQLNWKKDKEYFYRALEKVFVWDEPTKMQLQGYYQERLRNLEKTRLGKVYVEHDRDDFILEVAKLNLRENELHDFFRELMTLEELQQMVKHTVDIVQDDVITETTKKNTGPRIKYLFIDGVAKKEDTYVKNREKYRFMQYMKAHNLSSRSLTCYKDDTVNDILTCFLLHWIDMGIVEKNPSGAAIFRFVTEDCGFKSMVQCSAFANKIVDRLKNKLYDVHNYRLVSECFKKTISTYE